MIDALVLIRHGLTAWNQQRVLQGHHDVPLSAPGRWQAEQLARHPALETAPDAVYSSDLARARETAEVLVKDRPHILRLTPLLRERSFGEYEGRPFDEVSAQMELERLAAGLAPDVYLPPGGESRRQVDMRLRAFLEEIDRQHAGQRVWVISHGGAIRMMLRNLLGPRMDTLVSGFQIPNTGVSHLRRTSEGWDAECLNCIAHLQDQMPPDALIGTDESVIEDRLDAHLPPSAGHVGP